MQMQCNLVNDPQTAGVLILITWLTFLAGVLSNIAIGEIPLEFLEDNFPDQGLYPWRDLEVVEGIIRMVPQKKTF